MSAACSLPLPDESGIRIADPPACNWRLLLLAAAIAKHERRRSAIERMFIAAALLGFRVEQSDGFAVHVFPDISSPAATWQSGAKHDSPGWVAYATALESTVLHGKPRVGWMHDATCRKRYEPISIAWRELTPRLHGAFIRLADALEQPLVLADLGVEDQLERLNRLYKNWTRGKATETQVATAADATTACVLSAPRRVRQAEARKPLTSKEKKQVFDALEGHWCARSTCPRCDLLANTIDELEIGEFDPTATFPKRILLAKWRSEDRARQYRRRERVTAVTPSAPDPVHVTMSGKRSTQIADGDRRWLKGGPSLFDKKST